MKVDLDAYYGVQKITSGIPLLNTPDYLFTYLMMQRLNNAPGETIWNPLMNIPNGLDFDTNWMHELTNDNAPIQNYSLNISGGQKDLTYNFVMNYFKQDGSMINTDYDAFSLRSNSNYKKGKFTAFTSLGFNINNSNRTPWGLHDNAISLMPMTAPIDYSGNIATTNDENPFFNSLAFLIKETNTSHNYGLNGNAILGYEIAKGLLIQANIGGSISTGYDKHYFPSFLMYNIKGVRLPGGREISELNENISLGQRYSGEFTTNYTKSFNGGHSLNLLAGFTAEQSRWDTRGLIKKGFPNDEIIVPDAGTIGDKATGNNSSNSLVGLLARALYNYKDRYLVSGSIRRDGSSRFGENKWASFPSVSVGWNLSEERLFKNLQLSKFIENLKLRASIGTAGNQSIPSYSYDANIINNLDYVLGLGDQSTVMFGASQRGFANPLVKWETSVSRNFGFDMTILKSAITFTADYYYTNKKDMLLPVALAPSSGVPTGNWQFGSVMLNAGDMYNKGIELAATYKGGKHDFRFSFSGVFSKNTNMVTKTYVPSNYLAGGVPIIARPAENTTFIKEGFPAGSFFLIPNRGTIKTAEQLSEYKKIVGSAKLGDLWIEDTNNDGVLNDDDRVYSGKGTPDWEAGLVTNLTYKKFDFNIQIYGAYGNMVYNGAKLFSYVTIRSQDLLYAWSPWNPTSNIPSPRKELEHNNVRSMNKYFLEDGSYLRVRNVQIGYNLSEILLHKANMRNVRIYINAQNPFTLTKYTGYDPEIGGDGLFTKGVDKASYPVSSQYRIGVQIGF